MDLRAPADPYGDATLRTALSDSRGAYSFDTQCECTLGLERLCTQGELTECLRLAAKLDPASIALKEDSTSRNGDCGSIRSQRLPCTRGGHRTPTGCSEELHQGTVQAK